MKVALDQPPKDPVFVRLEDETACQLLEVIEQVLREKKIPAARAETVVHILADSAPAQAFLGDAMDLVAKFAAQCRFPKS